MLKRVTRPRVWRNPLYFPIGLYSYGRREQAVNGGMQPASSTAGVNSLAGEQRRASSKALL